MFSLRATRRPAIAARAQPALSAPRAVVRNQAVTTPAHASRLAKAQAVAETTPTPRPDREATLRNIAIANFVMLGTMLGTVVWIATAHDGLYDVPILGGVSKTVLIVAALAAIPAIFEPLIEFFEQDDPRVLGDESVSHWQTVTVPTTSAADKGVDTHFQTRNPASSPPEPARSTKANAALYHGFGANLWSWQDVQQQLADFYGGTVVAHDQAGFGLTFRPDESDEYEPAYNGALGRKLLGEVLDGKTAAALPVTGKDRILVAHSVGCAGVLLSVAQNGADVDEIMFVDPFIAPVARSRSAGRDRKETSNTTIYTEPRKVTEEVWQLNKPRPSPPAASDDEDRPVPARFPDAVVEALAAPAFFVFRAILRMALRTRIMWQVALGVVKSGNPVPENFLFAYRLPVLYKEWEAGIMLFTLVQAEAIIAEVPGDNAVAKAVRKFLDSVLELLFEALVHWSDLPETSPGQHAAAAAAGKPKLRGLLRLVKEVKWAPDAGSLKAVDCRPVELADVDRFREVLQKKDIKLTIVNGSKDILATPEVTRSLAAMLSTGSRPVKLLMMDGLGHTVAEEDPETFVKIVRKYMQ